MRQRTNGPKRDKMIGVLVTSEEYERLRALAFQARKGMGAFVRDLVLAARVLKLK